MRVFCALCSAGHAIEPERVRRCPACHRDTVWRSLPVIDQAQAGRPIFTEHDYRLLRSMRIAPD